MAGTAEATCRPAPAEGSWRSLHPLSRSLNPCFIIGKLTQAVSLGAAGLLGWGQLAASLPLSIVALLCLRLGMGFGKRLSPAGYRNWLDRTLWVMAGVLVAQVVLS